MNKKCYMIDLDGTMYWGTKILDGAKEFVDWLIETEQHFIFLTNNAARTQQQAANHMLKMGFENIKPEMFYTSAMAAAQMVSNRFPKKNKAYLIGEKGLEEALKDNNFEITSNHPDFVFIGLDRQGTYKEYSYALQCLLDGAKLVGCNDDKILLTENGINMGNGSIVKMFEHASGQKAIQIGKPHRAIIEGALRYANVAKEDVLIIGDNLETDIQLGINAKIDTVLVTTGIHNMEDCYRLNIKPTYMVANLMGITNIE